MTRERRRPSGSKVLSAGRKGVELKHLLIDVTSRRKTGQTRSSNRGHKEGESEKREKRA